MELGVAVSRETETGRLLALAGQLVNLGEKQQALGSVRGCLEQMVEDTLEHARTLISILSYHFTEMETDTSIELEHPQKGKKQA